MVGIDLSSNMVKYCRQSGIYKGVMEYDLCNGTPPMPEEYFFDLIVAAGVFEFIKEPKVLLGQIRELLTVDGAALITFEPVDALALDNSKPRNQQVGEVIKVLFTLDEIRHLIASANLKIVEEEFVTAYKSPTINKEISYRCFVLKRDDC